MGVLQSKHDKRAARQSIVEGQYAFDSKYRAGRHLIFTATLLVDLAICGLAIALYLVPVMLPVDNERYWSLLPPAGAILGSFCAGLNAVALSEIILANVKQQVLTDGITLHKLESLTFLSNGSYPRGFSLLFVFSIVAALAKAFIPSALVASLTPTIVLDEKIGTNAAISFSRSNFAARNGNPDIQCEYGQTYGYGFQCPMNSRYGTMYDVGMSVFTGDLPTNLTRNGMSYPSCLLGISGAFSSLSKDIYRLSVGSSSASPTPQDLFKVCVPRAVITTTCSPSLGDGFTANVVQQQLQIRQPRYITEFTLLNNGQTVDYNTFPDYGAGSIVPFGIRNPSTGTSSLFLISSGRYVSDLTSGRIRCDISAREEQVPILIRGGLSVELDPSFDCPAQSPPSNEFLATLTGLGQMAMQKQQGQDGRLEVVALARDPSTRLSKLAESLTRYVSIGATEMYSSLYSQLSNTSSIATYPEGKYVYMTPRLRLGNASWQSLLFLLAPLVFMIIILVGWVKYGFSRKADLHFNAMDPASVAIAGMNGFGITSEIAEECITDVSRAQERLKRTRFRFAVDPGAPDLLGLTADFADAPVPNTKYGASINVRAMSQISASKLSPGISTTPSTPFFQQYAPAPQQYMPMQPYSAQ